MPLLAELTNSLNAYRETSERIFQYLKNMCVSDQKSQDSPYIIQVQDLISIDAEWNRHLDRIESWEKRQKEIAQLEQELSKLSSKVNSYTRSLNAAQCSLNGFLYAAKELQKESQQKSLSISNDIRNSETPFSWLS